MVSMETYQDLLREFVAFQSISTAPEYEPELARTADWLAELLRKHGFSGEIWEHKGLHPLVYAQYRLPTKPGAEDAPTTLVYGHYDVQPAALEDGWDSDPFTLTERDGRLFGRGAVDNKGQILIHIATVVDLITRGKLAHNLTFLIEGDEETGSAGLNELLHQRRTDLMCDQILISDGEIPYRPTIEASLRGGFNLTVRYRTAAGNLHSGLYGGGVPNAAQELSKLIASFYNDDQRVAIPGFYNGVRELKGVGSTDADDAKDEERRLKQITGISTLLSPKGYSLAGATGLLPTLQVSGISSGYNGPGYANIVPATASANINVRTVAPQDATEVYEAVVAAIRQRTPDYVACEITPLEAPYIAIELPTDSPLVKHTSRLLKQVYGSEPLFSHGGGSIPIVADFKQILDKDSLLVRLGNDDCNMHGANENFNLELVRKGLEFSELFFSQRV